MVGVGVLGGQLLRRVVAVVLRADAAADDDGRQPGVALREPPQRESQEQADDELGDVDVVYLLRIQAERGSSADIPSSAGYARRYGMNEERLSMMKPTGVVMHPGPINRGVEIDDATADSERSLLVRQVANGVPVRMAVIAEALEGVR